MPEELIKVVISGDRMSAFLRVAPQASVTMQDLRDALAREGVTTGISVAALKEALEGKRGVFYRVASGATAEQEASAAGEPPVVALKFPESRGRPPERIYSGPGFREEWRRLRARGAVSAGDLLAFVRRSDKYPKATTVTGQRVVRIDFPDDMKPSQNAQVTADGTGIIALRTGIPFHDSTGIGVLDHIEIVGNLDASSGDVSFPGDLSVRGDVEQGCRVSATGDILISGNLWGSATARGRIVVSGGINAPGETIEAGGSITCRFAENSIIRSLERVTVEEAIVHCVVETERDVVVTGLHGRIVGGLVVAALGVKASTIGSPMGVPTVVQLGVSPKLRREQLRIERDLDKVTKDLERANLMTRSPLRTGDYDVLRLSRMRRHLQDQEAALRTKLESFREMLRRFPKGYFVADRVLPGVRVVMAADVKEFKSPADMIIMGAIPRETD